MLFDSDVLIWLLRGIEAAGRAVFDADERLASVVTYMELVQGARNQREAREVRAFLERRSFQVLPLSARIGDRAAVYVEEYALRSGLDVRDALIAATSVEHGVTLCTGNVKHYRQISELVVRPFRL